MVVVFNGVKYPDRDYRITSDGRLTPVSRKSARSSQVIQIKEGQRYDFQLGGVTGTADQSSNRSRRSSLLSSIGQSSRTSSPTPSRPGDVLLSLHHGGQSQQQLKLPPRIMTALEEADSRLADLRDRLSDAQRYCENRGDDLDDYKDDMKLYLQYIESQVEASTAELAKLYEQRSLLRAGQRVSTAIIKLTKTRTLPEVEGRITILVEQRIEWKRELDREDIDLKKGKQGLKDARKNVRALQAELLRCERTVQAEEAAAAKKRNQSIEAWKQTVARETQRTKQSKPSAIAPQQVKAKVKAKIVRPPPTVRPTLGNHGKRSIQKGR